MEITFTRRKHNNNPHAVDRLLRPMLLLLREVRAVYNVNYDPDNEHRPEKHMMLYVDCNHPTGCSCHGSTYDSSESIMMLVLAMGPRGKRRDCCE